MKFAKHLPESRTGANKMLNLLTCQVSHLTCNEKEEQSATTMKEAIHKYISKHINFHITLKEKSSISCDDFSTLSSQECYYLQHLLAVCHACTAQRLSLKPTECSSTFLDSVQSLMPYWTPNKKDNVVYATIEEALSDNIGDVEAYLSKVKKDLHISQIGYPEKVVLAGDQQTLMPS